MVSHRLAVGYHGCDLNLARRVIAAGGDLKPSQNAWDWLGHGIYFWEDSYARALRWAQSESQRRNGRIKRPGVLGAAIDLGNCLNLTEAESLELVKSAHSAYMQLCATSGVALLHNRGPELRARYLDCAVIETLHQLREEEGRQPFDTVRGFFVEGRELYHGAGFRESDHVQICVRSSKQIIGYFWPRTT
jgi:hypothetical protein